MLYLLYWQKCTKNECKQDIIYFLLRKSIKLIIATTYHLGHLLTCLLVFGWWKLIHVIFLMLRKKELLAKLSKFTNWQLFSLKRVIDCRFDWKLLSVCEFAQLCKQFFFFLSMRKITWLNSQQPKTKGHVDYLSPKGWFVCLIVIESLSSVS